MKTNKQELNLNCDKLIIVKIPQKRIGDVEYVLDLKDKLFKSQKEILKETGFKLFFLIYSDDLIFQEVNLRGK